MYVLYFGFQEKVLYGFSREYNYCLMRYIDIYYKLHSQNDTWEEGRNNAFKTQEKQKNTLKIQMT